MSKFQPRPAPPPEAVPDGGWGWVVVGSLFVSSALVFGLIRSLGVFFVEFVQHFDESAQVISWITSIGVAMQQLVSPVGTALCYAYGTRPVVMMGGFLSGMGFILASQATCVTHLYLTMGVISGSGWALVFTPTVASVMQYFTRRRSLAMALGFTGIGLSSFAFSPLFQLLVDTYTWRGALLILGGLSFNMVACGALIRPPGGPKAAVVVETQSDVHSSACASALSKAYSYLELSLLFQRPFLTYSLAITLFNFGYFVPYVHLVAHSRHQGFSQYQAAFIISATGVTDIVGRLVSGWSSDLGRLRLPHMLCLWTGLTGLFLLLVPLGSLGGSYPGLVVVSLAYGFCSGAMTPLVFSVVPEIVGMQRTLGALGLLQLIESVGGLLGAPLSGLLRDITGNYTASFEVAGIFVILGTLVTTMLPHFFSRTAPPPLASPRTPGQDTKDAESALMKSPSSFSEGLNHLDTLPFTEPQLDRSSLNLDQGDLPLKQGRSEVDNDC
ncbi:monocarboxylate transporter 13 [Hypomesus transpacificus]|uniref:monocarboxylate transporter 13 n=1 Tax=Hypomesus transpacificus TaxID=137520 RepID=UPI001F071955|nr:monocarboxylate transporter 13 [Hypomesus transpacificus]XP_046905276.1 monocarboxylate transporter 13 [Hypomesus transpacificus]XP_046905278.1 monocarboxylate transporter 13 [Hypomesus transpacificus]